MFFFADGKTAIQYPISKKYVRGQIPPGGYTTSLVTMLY
jgi:hypothetical protein